MEQKELLINAVFTYPCLWDICDNNYHNKYKKENAWSRVSEKCGGGFIDANMCKVQWKYLREKYKRQKKISQGRSGDGARNVKQWPLFEMMNFIDSTVPAAATVTNITSEEEKRHQNEEDVFSSQLGTPSSVFSNEMEEMNQSHIPFVHSDACVEDSSSVGVSDLRGSSTQDHRPIFRKTAATRKEKKKANHVEEHVIEALNKTTAAIVGISDFFSALGKEVARLPLAKRVRLQCDMMQLLANALENDHEDF